MPMTENINYPSFEVKLAEIYFVHCLNQKQLHRQNIALITGTTDALMKRVLEDIRLKQYDFKELQSPEIIDYASKLSGIRRASLRETLRRYDPKIIKLIREELAKQGFFNRCSVNYLKNILEIARFKKPGGSVLTSFDIIRLLWERKWSHDCQIYRDLHRRSNGMDWNLDPDDVLREIMVEHKGYVCGFSKE